jgi:hypothetical protein
MAESKVGAEAPDYLLISKFSICGGFAGGGTTGTEPGVDKRVERTIHDSLNIPCFDTGA